MLATVFALSLGTALLAPCPQSRTSSLSIERTMQPVILVHQTLAHVRVRITTGVAAADIHAVAAGVSAAVAIGAGAVGIGRRGNVAMMANLVMIARQRRRCRDSGQSREQDE